MKSFKIIPTIILIVICISSCKKLIEPDVPKNQLPSAIVFNDSKSAESAVLGIYSDMMTNENLFNFYICAYGGLSADELDYLVFDNEFAVNEVNPVNSELNTFWTTAYSLLYSTNAIIENLAQSSIPATDRLQLSGEAKFFRAYILFYLANLWDKVPMVNSTNYKNNAVLPQADYVTILAQVVSDLQDAGTSLPESYSNGEPTRVTKWAATAMLARVYLYQSNWPEAELVSTDLIDHGGFVPELDLNNVFQSSNTETIFELAPVVLSYNTYDGANFIPNDGFAPRYKISDNLMAAFTPGDLRKDAWVGKIIADTTEYPVPYKYKSNNSSGRSEYYVLLRMAELYLIRAEARATQNKVPEALEDLNVIHTRAGLAPLMIADQQELLSAIGEENRIEFFAEYGHRWFDIKRNNTADLILGTLKPDTWQSSDIFWPIPQQQINLNKQLIQNPGY